MGDLTDGHKHTFLNETMLAVSQIRVAEFIQILFGVFRNSFWPIDVILDHPKLCGHPCKNMGSVTRVVTRAMGDRRVTKKKNTCSIPPKDRRFQTFKDRWYLEIAAEGSEKIFKHFSKGLFNNDVTGKLGRTPPLPQKFSAPPTVMASNQSSHI